MLYANILGGAGLARFTIPTDIFGEPAPTATIAFAKGNPLALPPARQAEIIILQKVVCILGYINDVRWDILFLRTQVFLLFKHEPTL